MSVFLFSLGFLASLPVLALIFIIVVNLIRIPLEIAAMVVSFPLSLLDAIANRANNNFSHSRSKVGQNVHEGIVGCFGMGGAFLITLEIAFRIWNSIWIFVN